MRAPARPDPPGRRARRASVHEAPDLSGITRVDDPASLHGLLRLCAQYLPNDDLKLIYRAYQVAAAAHEGTLRQAGEPYIEHPLAVATILAELALDAQGIAAALLHDVVEDTSITREDVERDFGVAIAELVDGVTKFTGRREPGLRTRTRRGQRPALHPGRGGEARAQDPAAGGDDTQALWRHAPRPARRAAQARGPPAQPPHDGGDAAAQAPDQSPRNPRHLRPSRRSHWPLPLQDRARRLRLQVSLSRGIRACHAAAGASRARASRLGRRRL